jgi:RNA polymerase sigma-70 factor (ECF subfamily)
MSEVNTPDPPDAVLVQRAVRGELEAFELLIARYQRGIFNVAYYKSRNCFDAEDLSQDIFLAAFKALPTLKDHENFGGWLFGIAYNRCHKWYHRERNKVLKIQEVRRRKEQECRMARLQGGSPPGGGGEEGPALSELLQRLPEDVRSALTLKYLDGLSYQEIEKRLGIKPHRIDYLIRKGKRLLRERAGLAGGAADPA